MGKKANGHYWHVPSFVLGYHLKSLVKFWAISYTVQLARVGFCPEEFLAVVQSSVSPGAHLSGCPLHELRLHVHSRKCRCVVEESSNGLEKEGWRLVAEVLFQIIVCRLMSLGSLKPPGLNVLVFSPVRKTLFSAEKILHLAGKTNINYSNYCRGQKEEISST